MIKKGDSLKPRGDVYKRQVLLLTFVGRLSRVQGESMRETLQDRDLLLVLNGYLCGSYEAGDIVMCLLYTSRCV